MSGHEEGTHEGSTGHGDEGEDSSCAESAERSYDKSLEQLPERSTGEPSANSGDEAFIESSDAEGPVEQSGDLWRPLADINQNDCA